MFRFLFILLVFLSVFSSSYAREFESHSHYFDRAGDTEPSMVLSENVVERQKKISMCNAVARKEWLNTKGDGNLGQRHALFECMEDLYVLSREVVPEKISIENVAPNSLGIQLEKYNIWFYSKTSENKQRGGLNIYLPNEAQISWVIVGFHPSSCVSSGGYKWVMRLKLTESTPVNENAVWVWSSPEEEKLSDGGCLDILAAG